MKGIILKDLYENFRIFKNGVSYLAAVLFLFLLIEAMQTGDLFSLKYFFMLITAFVFPLLGCSSIESSLEQDEKVNFDKIQLTFPITKTEIVLSKYILGICFLTICNVFSLIFVFSFTSSHNKITLQEGLSAWGFGVLFSLVFFAVVNFAFFLLGRKHPNRQMLSPQRATLHLLRTLLAQLVRPVLPKDFSNLLLRFSYCILSDVQELFPHQ